MIWQLAFFLTASFRSSSVHELFPPDYFPVDHGLKGRSASTHFALMRALVAHVIGAAPCGDAGADTTVEAASIPKCTVSNYSANRWWHRTLSGRSQKSNPHRHPQSLHCSWYTCHRTCRLGAHGERGRTSFNRFVQQSLMWGIILLGVPITLAGLWKNQHVFTGPIQPSSS